MTTTLSKSYLWKATDQRRNGYQRYGERLVRAALNRQIAPVITAIRKGTDPEKVVIAKPIQDALVQLYTEVGTSFARTTYRELVSQKAEEPISQWQAFMRRFVNTRALERIKTMTETTLKHVRRVLGQAVKEGYGIEKTAELMTSEFKSINRIRARIIARTELVSSSNAGSLLGARSTGLKLKKEWLSTPGSRTRDTHKAANGQQKDLEKDFYVGGEDLAYPGDPKGRGDNVIQCRCSLTYEPV